MFKKFYPYEYANSVFDVDYKELYNKGYKGIIFDIDNINERYGYEKNFYIKEERAKELGIPIY